MSLLGPILRLDLYCLKQLGGCPKRFSLSIFTPRVPPIANLLFPSCDIFHYLPSRPDKIRLLAPYVTVSRTWKRGIESAAFRFLYASLRMTSPLSNERLLWNDRRRRLELV